MDAPRAESPRPASPFVLPPRLGGGPRPANGAPSPSAANGHPAAHAPPPPRPAPPAPPVATPPEPPPEPPKIPSDPAEAWTFALAPLNPYQRTTVLENTAFVSFAGGTLTLDVRNEIWRPIVREHLQELDFPAVLPGFRRFEIRLGDDGRTGREVRNAQDEARALAAREAVGNSPIVKRLVAMLGGRVEHIEASRLDAADRSAGEEDEG